MVHDSIEIGTAEGFYTSLLMITYTCLNSNCGVHNKSNLDSWV